MADTRTDFGDLLGIYNPLLIVVAAVVFGVVFFALVRYRRRPGREASQRKDATIVESLYVIGLAVIAAFLVAATFRVNHRETSVAGDPGLRVAVTAFKWQWRFDYTGRDVRPVLGTVGRPAHVVLPAGTTIRVTLTSRDVIHSFFIPELRFKRDAFPKRDTTFDLRFDRTGTFRGRCAEYCGLRHANMLFEVDVRTPSAFRAWLAGRSTGSGGGGA